MAATVDNLIRRLQEFCTIHDTRYPWIATELIQIEKYLQALQPFLHDAEWQRDLHEFRGRKDVRNKSISSWVQRTAHLAAEIEDIIVTCDFHLFNIENNGSLSRVFLKLQYLIKSEKDSVSNKIEQFLYRSHELSTESQLPTMRSNGHQASEDNTRLLRISKSSKTIHEVGNSWPKRLLGTDLVELLGKFSNKVIKEIKKFISEAVGMQLVRDSSVQVTPVMLSHEPRNAIQTILKSVKLLGRQSEISLLEGWLMKGQKEPGTVVLGVTGKAGIGKTTVATVLYEKMQRNYDCHAWIFLSSNPTSLIEDVLRGILKSNSISAPNNISTMEAATLKMMIHHLLSGKKFFLVLDDIPTHEELKEVKNCLPKDCRANILLTSRECIPGCNDVLFLQRLTAQDAFHLLHMRTCLENQNSFWPSVKSESEQILKTCKGLPLAITTIGGMLSTKQMEVKEWTKVHHMLEKASYMPLCYADLDPVLKSCFLYAASFPSHAEIPCKRLERLWIAEGFVKKQTEMTAEEVAKIQLHELIQRNMIQIARVGKDGEVETCRLLKPIRAFALKRSEQDQFSMVLDSGVNSLPKQAHRLFLHTHQSNHTVTSAEELDLSRLYSLLEFKGNKYLYSVFSSARNFKLLCVLDLQQLGSGTLPDAVGDLVLLRYLGLRDTKLLQLPQSLKRLRRLQTLDIRETLVRDLPTGLEVLDKLKHLLLAGSYSNEVVTVKGEMDYFKDLLTLAGVKLTDDIAKQLHHLSQLQKLSVGEVKSRHSKSLSKSIDGMKYLRSLTIKCALTEQIFINSINPLESLEKLRIGGQVSNLLDWVPKLHSLKHLYLWDCFLTEDPFLSLQCLPNLLLLSLCNAYKGEEIKLDATGFPKLQKLSILYSNALKRWAKIEGRALRNLEILTIGYCTKLIGLPEGLNKLTSLVTLELADMPEMVNKQARTLYSTANFSLLLRDTSQLPSPVVQRPATKRLPPAFVSLNNKQNMASTSKVMNREFPPIPSKERKKSL